MKRNVFSFPDMLGELAVSDNASFRVQQKSQQIDQVLRHWHLRPVALKTLIIKLELRELIPLFYRGFHFTPPVSGYGM
jgi:hypothetical protein